MMALLGGDERNPQGFYLSLALPVFFLPLFPVQQDVSCSALLCYALSIMMDFTSKTVSKSK
jgi:hypothetical protein